RPPSNTGLGSYCEQTTSVRLACMQGCRTRLCERRGAEPEEKPKKTRAKTEMRKQNAKDGSIARTTVTRLMRAALCSSVIAMLMGSSLASRASLPSVELQSSLSDFDRDFLTKSALVNICHIQLGELAVARAENSDVRQFGRRMAVEHTRTLAEANALASQKSHPMPRGPDKEQQATRLKLDGMSGAVFDHAYLEIVMKKLEENVQLFERESSEGSDE